jgi:formylglycine-generating enzyme required for sulfatase activity
MSESPKGIGAAGFSVDTSGGVNYLLAIAIDSYKHMPRLYNCKKDAETFIELLVENYQFEEKHVTRLLDGQATLEGMHAAFRSLIDRVGPQDNLLVFFSGHGEYDSLTGEGFWIPVNGRQGSLHEYFPNDTVRRYLSSINSRHTFLIADSCFAGALFEEGTGKSGGPRSERDPSRWGLTAGRKEVVSDGKPGMHSPFADALLYRLRNNEGSLGVQKLCADVLEQVEANAWQTPVGEPLRVKGHRNGQFYFHPKGAVAQKVGEPEIARPLPRRETPKPQSASGFPWKLPLSISLGLIAVVLVVWQVIKPSTPVEPAEKEPTEVSETPAPFSQPETIAVQGGTFTMGCTSEQGADCFQGETPAHQVSLKSFSIGKYEVTNAEYSAFLNEKGNQTEGGATWLNFASSNCMIIRQGERFAPQTGYDRHPVVGVSWYGAKAYCAWLSVKTGKEYRLPTEAEWEYAARGGRYSKGFKYAGGNDLDAVAWHSGNAGSSPKPVGTKNANELGLFDMSGNVWEWCSDIPRDYSAQAITNPAGHLVGDNRVSRGGDWHDLFDAQRLRVSARNWDKPAGSTFAYGFRVAGDF